MDFNKTCLECYSHKPKHPCNFLAKSMRNFLFLCKFIYIFLEFYIFYYRISIFKTKMGKNMQMLLQKIKIVLSRPNIEKKYHGTFFFRYKDIP